MTDFETFDLIRENNPKHYTRIIQNKYKDIWNSVISYNNKYQFSNISNKQMLYNWRYSITEWPKCVVCGKPVIFGSQDLFKYSVCCSKKCFGVSEYRMKKYEKTCLEKYGCTNAFANDDVKRKIIETNIKKYGDPCFIRTKTYKEKTKQTSLMRYGTISPAQSNVVKEKRKKTCLAKYGEEYASKSDEVKKKIRETQILKYGSFGGWMTDEIKNKIILARKATYMNMYGVPHNPNAISKLKMITTDAHNKFIQSIPDMFPDYELMDDAWNKKWDLHTWKCKICGNVFIRSGFPRCIKCHPLSTSIDQEDIFNYVKSICPDAVQNNRSILPSKMELDIYIPSRNIGIEYNGLFWHCENSGKDKNYHVNKTNEANSVGVRLLQVFSDEWLDPNKQKIIKWKLSYLLGKMPFKSIFARKCEARVISHDTATKFHEKYHIQGGDKSKINIGLFYRNKIVAVGSFQPTGTDGVIQLSRYSTIFTRTITGGLGKIISFFSKTYIEYKKIITFADRRYSNGDMYRKLGFTEIGISGPYYWYTRDYKTRIHRFRLRKTRLKMWDVCYDKSWTERQLAVANGYVRIWDCGQIKFELNINQQKT